MVDAFARRVREAAAALPPAAELGFGRHLGPWVVLSEHDGAGWSEARVAPLEACGLPVGSAAVQYGSSAFEGIKAYRGPDGRLHLFRPDAYARRLGRSTARLCLPTVEPERFVALCAMAAALHEPLVPAHGAGSLYLRPIVCATEAFLGPRTAKQHVLYVIVNPCAPPATRPQRLYVEAERLRAAPGGLGGAKTGANYAAGLGALEAARARGFDQVLFLDGVERRRLSESSSTNVFVVLDDRVVTPPLDDTILAGITRDTCLSLLRARGLVVEERAPALDELAAWAASGRLREIFCTGTATAVLGAAELVGPGLAVTLAAPGPVTADLRAALEAAEDGRADAPAGWRVPVGDFVAPAPSLPPRNPDEARAFAERWATAWSARDAEAVLAWFADDCVFTSPRAHEVIGQPAVHGKAALRDYWQRAMARIERIQFEVEEVTFEAGARRLCIGYVARIDGRALHAVEILTFDGAGRIVRGAAYHGAPATV